jgi:hypothetical protein
MATGGMATILKGGKEGMVDRMLNLSPVECTKQCGWSCHSDSALALWAAHGERIHRRLFRISRVVRLASWWE